MQYLIMAENCHLNNFIKKLHHLFNHNNVIFILISMLLFLEHPQKENVFSGDLTSMNTLEKSEFYTLLLALTSYH